MQYLSHRADLGLARLTEPAGPVHEPWSLISSCLISDVLRAVVFNTLSLRFICLKLAQMHIRGTTTQKSDLGQYDVST